MYHVRCEIQRALNRQFCAKKVYLFFNIPLQILLQQEGSKSVLMALSWELRKIGLQDPDISTLMCQVQRNFDLILKFMI